MDADSAGYLAARGKVKETLEKLEIPYLIADMPEEWGKDPGDAWAGHPDEFQHWIKQVETRIAPSDTDYVGRLVSNEEESLLVVPTPYPSLNGIFNGGYKTGVHVLAGTPGTGKTAYCARQAVVAAAAGTRVLYVSGEISKRQMWARVASCLPRAQEWRDLEMDMSILTKKNQSLLVGLTDTLHIRAGWNVNAIVKAAQAYDLIFVDYLQRLPDTIGGSDDNSRAAVGAAASRLSDVARDMNKVIICVSSMPRAAYKNPKDMNIFKDSGNIEYVVQSGAALVGLGNSLSMWIIKNTRGLNETGFRLNADLGHCHVTRRLQMQITEEQYAKLVERAEESKNSKAEAFFTVFSNKGTEMWSGLVLACSIGGQPGQFVAANFYNDDGDIEQLNVEGLGISWVVTYPLLEAAEDWKARGFAPEDSPIVPQPGAEALQ
jgi:hypothetical protein